MKFRAELCESKSKLYKDFTLSTEGQEISKYAN
jgi:hypothetical protein